MKSVTPTSITAARIITPPITNTNFFIRAIRFLWSISCCFSLSLWDVGSISFPSSGFVTLLLCLFPPFCFWWGPLLIRRAWSLSLSVNKLKQQCHQCRRHYCLVTLLGLKYSRQRTAFWLWNDETGTITKMAALRIWWTLQHIASVMTSGKIHASSHNERQDHNNILQRLA